MPPPREVKRWIPLVGFNDNSVAQGLVSASDDARLLSRAGANAVRVTLDWAVVERFPGMFDFTVPDRLYRAMSRRGIRIVWIPMFAPQWAAAAACPPEPQPCHLPPSPAHDGDWKELIARIAQRYPRSAGIEVWNEPNYVAFWQPRPDPARYVQLLAEAYAAAKHADPSIPVVAAGLGDSPPAAPGDQPLVGYLSAMLADGAAAHADAVAVHPYPYAGDQSPFVMAMAQVEQLLKQYGRARMPIWITEVGVSTTGPAAVTPNEQAHELSDLYRRAAAIGSVRAVFFHTLLDPVGTPDNPEAGYGILTSRGVPKPAAAALARLFTADRRLSPRLVRPR